MEQGMGMVKRSELRGKEGVIKMIGEFDEKMP